MKTAFLAYHFAKYAFAYWLINLPIKTNVLL